MKYLWVFPLILVIAFCLYKQKTELYTPPFTSSIDRQSVDHSSIDRQSVDQSVPLNDYSLIYPTLVDVTSKGPYLAKDTKARKDCLSLKNPGTLVKTCIDFEGMCDFTQCSKRYLSPPFVNRSVDIKTSSQWYMSRPDKNQVILNPTGWLDLVNPTQYWYSHLLSHQEYQQRMSKSVTGPLNSKTTAAVKFPGMEDEQPF